MIGIAGKTTNNYVFGALPLDPGIAVGLRQLTHPFEYFLFGGFICPMQSLTASYDGPRDNLRIDGSKEDGPHTTRSLL